MGLRIRKVEFLARDQKYWSRFRKAGQRATLVMNSEIFRDSGGGLEWYYDYYKEILNEYGTKGLYYGIYLNRGSSFLGTRCYLKKVWCL